jgi:hypothetical protein
MTMTTVLLVLAALLQSPPPTVRTVVKGAMSGVEARREVVIRSAAEWAALWKEHGVRDPLPAVDFSREMVVGVFLGVRNTTGYGVEIVRAVGNGSVMTVQYVEASPGRDAITAQVLTAPYHLAAMPKHDGEVGFQKVDK